MEIGVLGVSLNKHRRQGGHLLLFSHENRRKGGHLACLPYSCRLATTTRFLAKKELKLPAMTLENAFVDVHLRRNWLKTESLSNFLRQNRMKQKVWQTFETKLAKNRKFDKHLRQNWPKSESLTNIW